MAFCSRTVVLLMLVVASVAAVAILSSQDAEAITIYDLELTYKDASNVKVAQAQRPITFNYTIKHTGAYLTEEIIVELRGEPALWTHFISAATNAGVTTSTNVLEILLQRSEVATLTLTVVPDELMPRAKYWLTLNAYPKKDPNVNRSHDICLYRLYGGVEVRLSDGPADGRFTAYPSGTVTAQFAVFNLGNVDDVFGLSAAASPTDAGWTVAIVSGTDSGGRAGPLRPDPGRSSPHLVGCSVGVPADALAGAACTVTVRAVSTFEPTQWAEASATVVALQVFGLELRVVGEDSKTGFSGELVDFQLRAFNTGNGQDAVGARATWDPELAPGFMVTVAPLSFVLGAGGSADVTLSVAIPEDAPKKVYFFSAELASSSPGLPPAAATVEVEVRQSYGIGLTSPCTSMTARVSGVVDFEIEVLNLGNGLDCIRLDVDAPPPGWTVYVQPPEISLLQAERMRVGVRAIVPSGYDDARAGPYALRFHAQSTRGDASAELLLKVTVEQFQRVEWMRDGRPITDMAQPVAKEDALGPGPSMNPYEANRTEVALVLGNFGNGDDEVSVHAAVAVAGVAAAVSPPSAAVRWMQNLTVTVAIEVPRDLAPGAYSLKVVAESSNRSLPARIVTVWFNAHNINARVPPSPTAVSPVIKGDPVEGVFVRVGARLQFTLPVENAGDAPLPECIVLCYDVYQEGDRIVRRNFLNVTVPPIAVGGSRVLGGPAASGTSLDLSWSALVPGKHSLEFVLACDHQSVASDDVSRTNVTVDWNAPTVVGGPDNRWALPVVLVAAAVIAVMLAGWLRRRRSPGAT